MLRHYLVLSLKVLMRRKFFTFISVFGVGFTLLVLMVVTAVFDHQFAPAAPESRQGRILASIDAQFQAEQGGICCGGGLRLYNNYARNLPGAERLSIFSNGDILDSYVEGRKLESSIKRTDGEFWRILDFTFVEGRPYSSQEVDDAAFVAVITRATRERFFGSGSATGKTLEADGQRFRVIGVVENVSALRRIPYADIWVPLTTRKATGRQESLYGPFSAVVLAAQGASLPLLQSEFNSRVARLTPDELGDMKETPRVVAPFETTLQRFARSTPFADQEDPTPQTTRAIAFVTTAALLFVLLPTLNLVNINVSRIMERASEIGVRKAFGASSRTLVAQFVVENVILTLVGGTIGLLLSTFVLRGLNESGFVAHSTFAVNVRVFLYGLLIAAVFGVISGVYPAWRMSRMHPVAALRGANRS